MTLMARMSGALCVVALVACGGGQPEAAAPPPSAPAPAPQASADAPAPSASATPSDATTGAADDMAARGAKLYADHCAGCHGDSGEGNAKAPAVVGKNALPLDAAPPSKHRKVQFHTAADVFAFVKETMPPKKPGSLTDDEYLAIMAFDLKANGVDLKGKKLDAALAKEIVLHP